MKYTIITPSGSNHTRLQAETVIMTWTGLLEYIENYYHISYKSKLEAKAGECNVFRGDGDTWPDVIVFQVPDTVKTDKEIAEDYSFDDDNDEEEEVMKPSFVEVEFYQFRNVIECLSQMKTVIDRTIVESADRIETQRLVYAAVLHPHGIVVTNGKTIKNPYKPVIKVEVNE